MILVVMATGAMLCLAAVFAVLRLERGPSMLDRTVAFDVLTATLVAAVGAEAAWNRDVDTVPVLVALSLVGFLGSVAIARFAAAEPADGDGSGSQAEADVDPGETTAGPGEPVPRSDDSRPEVH